MQHLRNDSCVIHDLKDLRHLPCVYVPHQQRRQRAILILGILLLVDLLVFVFFRPQAFLLGLGLAPMTLIFGILVLLECIINQRLMIRLTPESVQYVKTTRFNESRWSEPLDRYSNPR